MSGCEYCMAPLANLLRSDQVGSINLTEAGFIEAEVNGYYVCGKRINYCPMCGAQLRKRSVNGKN